MSSVIIIGAGAAGLATAIFTRRANPRASVIILDGATKPGAKILVSGGGRCNVTNTVVTERDFWGGSRTIVRRILSAFPAERAVRFFREIGVELREESDGKLFPVSNRARDVLEALLREADRVGVSLQRGQRVEGIRRTGDGVAIVTPARTMPASRVVFATGGRSLPKTGSDGAGFELARSLGHTIVPTTPALAPLLLDENDALHRTLSGVSQDVELSVWVDGKVDTRLSGAMLWTHFGVSGPVALNASRHWERARLEGRPVRITVSFRPHGSFESVDAELTGEASARPRTSIGTALAAVMPASVASGLLAELAIERETPFAHLARNARRRLVRALVEFELPVIATRGYNFAEVTAGGVSLDEIDARTMRSRLCPEVYFVGEILDVDGRIGGFNFQWAWSTAWVAGQALAASVA